MEDRLIVEIKSVEAVAPVHSHHLLTHLRLAGNRLGLLINCDVVLIKDGITASRTVMDTLRAVNTPRRSETEPRSTMATEVCHR